MKPTHQIGTRNRAGISSKPMRDDQSTNRNPFFFSQSKTKDSHFSTNQLKSKNPERDQKTINSRGKLILGEDYTDIPKKIPARCKEDDDDDDSVGFPEFVFLSFFFL